MTSWRSAPLPNDWPRRRRRILARDGSVCRLQLAGCEVTATEVDHVIPAAQGGTDEDDNLQSVCTTCHRKKTIQQRRPPRRRPNEPHPGGLR